MLRTGSSSKRQAGSPPAPTVPTVPPAAIDLQRECTELRDRIAGYLEQKPPRLKAARLCELRLNSVVLRLLKYEIRASRRTS